MQELLAQSSFDKLKEGAIVPGTITEIRQNEVVVDIGGKSEGVIPANEFIDIGELQIGSSIDVMVEKLEDKSGAPVLSYDKAEQKKNWDNILTKFPEGSVAAGRVKAKVKGGLIISIGVDAFMPASPRRSRRLFRQYNHQPTDSAFAGSSRWIGVFGAGLRSVGFRT